MNVIIFSVPNNSNCGGALSNMLYHKFRRIQAKIEEDKKLLALILISLGLHG